MSTTSGTSTGVSKRPARTLGRLMRLLPPLLVVLAALAVQWLDPHFRARIRDNAFDQLQNLMPAVYQDQLPVRIVAIDDASLAQLGQWPWSHDVVARIFARLAEYGARMAAVDVVFAEPDRTSPEQLAARWPEQRVLREQLLRLPTHDRQLADSLTRLETSLGFAVEPQRATPAPPLKARFLAFGGDAREWLPAYAGGLASLPLLTDAAQGSGAVSLPPGDDGVVRSLPLLYRIHDTLYPSFDLEALRLFSGAANLAVHTRAEGGAPGIEGIGLDKQTFLPTASDGRVWLRFRPLAERRYVSAQALLAGRADPTLFKDHLVYLGATAKGLGDNVYSPLGEFVPGVEIHAQMAEQLLDGSYLLRPAWENDLISALLLGLWALLAFLLARYRPVWSVLAGALVVLALFALSVWLFSARQLLFDPFFPALAVSALFLALVVPGYIRSEREQRWIRDAFSRYVSPNRVKYLQDNPQHLDLGSQYRECSFVMTDLEGFTSLMEKHTSGELSELLNEYLDGMIQIAFRHDGTLDRIVGDAVAVMFSAPLEQPDHAARALACALEMNAFAQAFCRRCREQGVDFGLTRIGVNTGQVLVGNFGGKAMLDYRALGDAINTAARLESVNKQLGTLICVSGSTIAQSPSLDMRPIGLLVLKGKQNEIAAFEPLIAMDPAQLADYLDAYAHMEAGYASAGEAFRALTEKYPHDPLAAFHARRLAAGENGCRVVMKEK